MFIMEECGLHFLTMQVALLLNIIMNTLRLMLNVDWFNLFIHNIYLVGVVYLTILNLPRALRFKRENIILYGLIPGRSEPLLNINTYLEPLVKDLLVLWKGVLLNTKNYSKESFREVLVNVSCDVPAGRKVCDFLSHNANLEVLSVLIRILLENLV